MKGYIQDLRVKYGHATPTKPQHSLHKHHAIVYGAKTPLSPEEYTCAKLVATGIKCIQGIVGSLLYYARAVNNKLLVSLSTIGSQQAAATANTIKAINQLLNYVATYPDNGTTFQTSHMILTAHYYDAIFLNETKLHSHSGAHIFLSKDDRIPRSMVPSSPLHR